MKRYYLCDIVTIDTPDGPEYFPAIHEEGLNYVVQMPLADPVTGVPQGSTCLVLLAAKNHGSHIAKARVNVLPDVSLDMRISAMHGPTKQAMRALLQAKGFPVGVIAAEDKGYRDTIRGIGQALEPAFHENNFDVSDT